MKAEDYIKDSEGNKVYINRKGMQLFKNYMAKKGGEQASLETGLHVNTFSNLKKDSTCMRDTWLAIFEAMTKQIA